MATDTIYVIPGVWLKRDYSGRYHLEIDGHDCGKMIVDSHRWAHEPPASLKISQDRYLIALAAVQRIDPNHC